MNDDAEQRAQNGHRGKLFGDIQFKLRSVFVPYLAIATGLPIVYSLLHWLLIVYSDVPLLDEELTSVILPICLPWFVILPWFRHHIKLLRWPRQDDAFLGYIVAWLSLAAPTVIAQKYLVSAAGDLTRLERVSQIDARPPTKFYTIRDFTVDKGHARQWVRTSTSGRHSEYWDINVYYAIPLLDPQAKFDARHSTAWLGMPYVKQLSSRLSPEEKSTQLTAFVLQSQRQLNGDDFRWIKYLSTIGRNRDREALESALQNGTEYHIKSPPLLLSAHAEPFESRAGSKIPWFFASYGAGVGVWLLLALTMKIDESSRRRWTSGGPPTNGDLRVALAMLVPRKTFFITPLFIDLSVLVWVAMLFCGLGIDSISAADLLNWGAVHASHVQGGELWRLLTSLFVHAGILHLANNMVSLFLVGLLLEGAFGPWCVASVYLISGIAGSLGSMASNPAIVSVGASGSIFGLAGFGLVLLLVKRRRFAAERPGLLTIAGLYLGINLLLGAILPGIDLVAHLVGLASGGVLGLIASPMISDKS